jgi:hypothetical protein
MKALLTSCFLAAGTGIASMVGAELLDPRDFDWHHGWAHLLEVALGAGASSIGIYLMFEHRAREAKKHHPHPHPELRHPEHTRKRARKKP